jgi:ribosome biogenesis GTPase
VLLVQPGSGISAIVDILPQRTRFSRGGSGRDGADQVVAAGIDTVFIVTAGGRRYGRITGQRARAGTPFSGPGTP